MDDAIINVKFNHYKAAIPIGIDETDDVLLSKMYGMEYVAFTQLISGFDESNEASAKKLTEKVDLTVLHGKSMRIAFLGDSITSDRQSYMNIIKKALSGEKGICFGDFAISGFRSGNLLGRFNPDVRSFHADIAHIMIGTNDIIRVNDERKIIYTSPSEYEKNIDYIIGEYSKEKTKVIISTIPVFSRNKISQMPKECKILYREDDRLLFNDIIRKVADRYGAIVNEMDDIYLKYDPDDLTEPEGIHLSALGHELMAEALMKRIRELFY